MRKVGLKPGGGNKVAPFLTPSEAPLKNCPFRTYWGHKFRVWGPCAQAVRKCFGQRDGFVVRTLCAHTQSFMIPLHSRECYHALYCTYNAVYETSGRLVDTL